ncbi:hypothetical protein GH714_044044 [Hevea brasiliensis]|uniref:Retrotransposon gag domain-containing protein n=1 Tax=Hevea brasiliensis TaxID=3981 RepID=A0A6A6K241_HEVBR|nr:hypothetical protein GH714_044044 [Hevea brasiliensis]
MSDPSEIVPGTSCAPTVVEQGSRRRRGKSRDPSRAREELGDIETRLAKIELHLIDGDEKIEELDTRMEELDRGMDEFREEMQGALNQAIDKVMGEGESLKISFSNEVAALREENRFLREELDRVLGKVKDMEEQMSLVRMAILQGSVVGAATTSIAPTARVEVPKPNAFHGGRNAKEIDNFLWSLEQYFRALGITEDARKIDHAPLYLADTAMVWWRRRLLDIERGTCTISTWDDFKRELKKQFYPENAAHEARAKLRRLSHKGSIREYVKEFMETLLEIPDYPDTEALFAFTDGLQNWARLEIERRGARDLATAVSIAESLIELHRRERNPSPRKERNEGSSSHGKDGSCRPYKPKEGHHKVQKEDQGMQRPPLSCFLCDGPHRARECPKKSRLSALIEEREEDPRPQREATIGSLQLCALKVEGQRTVEPKKGLPFVQMKVGGQEVLALVDTGASNNFLREEEAKRLGIPYEREMGWLKAVNSTPNLVHGVARNVKVRIGDWKGTLDFFVVSMDEYQCVLGVDFIDRVKAIPMLFANSICITEGGGTYMVPVLRGKPSPSKTLATMHMEVQKPSSTTTAVVQGKEQHGKGGGTPKSGPKECKRGHTPELLKGHPPRRKVDCARGKSVAKSPRDVASPRQESPRQNRSWRSRRRCKAKERAGAPSHKDEGGTEAQLEQAQGNKVEHGRRQGRRSKRRGRRWD